MAKPPCSNQDGNEAYLSIVNLDNGEVATPCIECIASFAMPMAAAFSVGLSPEEAEAFGEYFDQIAANDTRQPAGKATARPKARRKPAAGLTADQPADLDQGTPPPPASPPSELALAGRESNAAVAVALDPPCSQCGGVAGTGDDVKLTCDGCGAVIATADNTGPTGIE